MVTQITLGNFFQQNGRTVVGGSQSGLDTESIINALSDARRVPAVRLEDKIKVNDTKTEALNSLKDILTRFKDAADILRNPPGVSNSSKNIFSYRTTSLSTNNANVAENYLSVIAQPGSQAQNLTINDIEQIALGTKQDISNSFTVADPSFSVVGAVASANEFGTGAITIRDVTGGPDVSISLATGDSLATVASKFNAVKDKTGFQATIIKVANNDYRLSFSSIKTGTTYGFDLGNVSTVTSDPSGVLSGFTFNTPQTAQNARFTVDNVVVEREENTVSDLISGLSFTLKAATPNDGTVVNVSIVPDEEIVKNAVTKFADAYNEFRVFATKQTSVDDDGSTAEDAVLSNNQALRTMISRVGAEIATVVDGLSNGQPSRLADIGIEFTDFAGDDENPYTRNIIQINEEKLSTALSSNFEGVAGVFQFQMTSSNTALSVFKRTNGISQNEFTLNIDRTLEVYTATYVDGFGSPQTVNFTATPISGGTGITLKAAAGSALDGLEFIFASASTNATIDVSLSQGVGDRIFNAMDDALKADTGVVTAEIKTLEETNKRYETEIARIDSQIERYREQLQAQYAALEAALSRANQLLQALDAQQQAAYGSS